jgi:tRNA (guanine-N7-)-methyltransferase
VGKNKLSKFSEMETFSNVLQVSFSDVNQKDHSIKGNWAKDFFNNNNPIVIELGCGKGEYTVGLAEMNPEVNFIGLDIKGARMWKGARYAIDKGLKNVAFLRTHIEMADKFFGADEISEIWLTFPDPQMKKTRKRLTSVRFIELYKKFLKEDGIIHLKTDSNFQYKYTLAMVENNKLKIVQNTPDVYENDDLSEVLKIKTYYEKQWLGRGIKIKYLSFIPDQNVLNEPDIDIEPDTYRSFGRGALTV